MATRHLCVSPFYRDLSKTKAANKHPMHVMSLRLERRSGTSVTFCSPPHGVYTIMYLVCANTGTIHCVTNELSRCITRWRQK
jgi:hypothetical protein